VYNNIADVPSPAVNATEATHGLAGGRRRGGVKEALPPLPLDHGPVSRQATAAAPVMTPAVVGEVIYSNAEPEPAVDAGEVIYEAYGSSDEEDDGGDGAGGGAGGGADPAGIYAVMTGKGKGKSGGGAGAGDGKVSQTEDLYSVPTSKGARGGGGGAAAATSRPALPPKSKSKLSEQQRNVQNWLTSNAGRVDAAEALGAPGVSHGCFCIRNNSSGQGKAIVLLSDQGKVRHYRLVEIQTETGVKYGMQDVKAWNSIQLDSIQAWLDKMSQTDAREHIQTVLTACVPCPAKVLA